jgi:type I pantothenate kinase
MPLEDIHDLARHLRSQFEAARAANAAAVHVLAVAGGVAAGKSTFAGQLAGAMAPWAGRIEIVSTDGFLFPNNVLAERELSMRKGFPESYDIEALRSAIAAIRRGEKAALPRYSHVTYDVDTSNPHVIEKPNVMILDGLHLGRIDADAPAGSRLVDSLIYLDADEAAIEQWFTDRLLPLMVSGRDDPNSFYFRFREMDDAARRSFVKQVWFGINLPNLRDHIVQDRARADIVVRKAADHAIAAIERCQRG